MHREAWRDMSAGRRVWFVALHILLGIAFMGTVALVFGFAVMMLWNAILPDVIGARSINFWQAVGLLILSRLMVGGFHHGKHGWRRRRRQFGRWKNHNTLDRFVEHGRTTEGAP